MINGTLFAPDNPSIGRQFPNPEADTLWDEFALTRTIVISAEDVRKLGKDPETVAKFEDDYWHLGENAYMAQLDVFHQLHCLNTFRHLAYPQYYEAHVDHPLWYIHLNHCMDVLMQNIMCNANTDLVTMQWMETQAIPQPDFSINHQCRDFNTLLSWRKETAVDLNKWIAMVKPKGVYEVPVQEEFWEIFDPNKTGYVKPVVED